MSITDIGKEQAQAISESRDVASSATLDDTNYIQLDQYPTTAIGGSARSLRRCSHSRLEKDFIGLTLTDPFVYCESTELDGTIIFKHTGSNELSLVNHDDPETHASDRYVTRPDNTSFRGDMLDVFREVEGFDPSRDRITVRLTGRAGRYMALCLDDCGLQYTNIVRDSTGVPMLAGNGDPFDGVTVGSIGFNVRLRPELRGETVVLMLQRTEDVVENYDGGSYWPNVLSRGNGAGSEYTVIEPNIESSVVEMINRG